ncbi:uncharacterized protein LOC126737942 [Anthonomus grandis grandis]|uniref:uncharacterized protein LOC126737942 n=1 Tax=Anthonomus grandis grandis TaxID=2921223 RepID=UPI00216641E0|nr:uncharacterized protein LOC126737942 [Anthonomus grandis grandis]
MPCVYKCCLWFSLRLGNILIAVFSTVKSLILIGLLLRVGRDKLWTILRTISSNLEFTNENTEFITQKFHSIYMFVIMFYLINCITSIMLGFGAYLCNRCLCFPFIIQQIAYFILGFYPATIFFRYLSFLAFESVDEEHRAKLSLPTFIGIVTTGQLYVAFMLYLTVCSYSFTEVVRILRKQVKKQQKHAAPTIFKNNYYY